MDTFPQLNSWIGRLVGDRARYRIADHLGGGGMGDVFLAIDTLLGQEVALKLIKERLISEGDLRKRFEREVLLCAAIKSDNVIQVKDYGLTSEGYPFYVMEYLRGQTLGQLLRQEKQLSPERSLSIINQVCHGLAVAHKGVVMWHDGAADNELIQVVHRDLKPENIFLVPTTIGELVKILDFGIAKAISSQAESTQTGIFIGTFRYAAPEQLETRKDIDGRADIYSLGIILYEMLSGTDPFGCDEEGITGGIGWVQAHLSRHPKALRLQPGCENLPTELEAVVMQCLKKTPNERFVSVEVLSQALKAAARYCYDAKTTVGSLATEVVQFEKRAISQPSASKASPEIPVNLASAKAEGSGTGQNNAQPTCQFSQSLEMSIQKKLELLLASYIGPIAPILLKQALVKCADYRAFVEDLSKSLPVSSQSEFRKRAYVLLDGDRYSMSGTSTVSGSTSTPPSIVTQLGSLPGQVLDPDFVRRCEQELTEAIGPMGRLIVQRAQAKKTSAEEFVDAVAKQIPDPKRAEAFRQRMLKER